jgi:glutathione S-transferase
MDAAEAAQTIWKTDYLFETDVHALVRCGKDGDQEPPRFRLAYLPARNRGEILRLMLEESGCSYDLELIGFRNWENGVKATTPHGKCPVLRNYDGKGNDLGQEGAITRFLAKELGLAGRNPLEEAQVDSIYSFWFSTMRNNGVSHDGEHYSVAALRDADPTSERPRYQEVFRQNTLSRAERSLMALGYFEGLLETSGSGFLISGDLTYVDLGLFYILFELAEEDNVPDFAEKFHLPRLGAFLESMQNRPNIKKFIVSPGRMPRYERAADGTSLYTYVEGKGSPRRRKSFG